MQASVVIITRNRRDELGRALGSAVHQEPKPEVIVVDDGSTDGTAAMVQADFPGVLLFRHEASAGYIQRRNEASQLATGEIIVSMDDDAEFSSPRVIEQTLRDFDSHLIGAVTIPYRNVNREPHVRQKPPDDSRVWLTDSFAGTAHAVRRDLFLRIQGYRSHLVHQGEESDFCIRMLARNFFVRLGRADPIHHHESPKRDQARMDYYGARNSILFAWHNVPGCYLAPHLAAATWHALTWSLQPKRFALRARAILHAYRSLHRLDRCPVSKSVYRQFRRLRRQGAVTLDSVATELDTPVTVHP